MERIFAMSKIFCISCDSGTNGYEWLSNLFIFGKYDNWKEDIDCYVYPDGFMLDKMK